MNDKVANKKTISPEEYRGILKSIDLNKIIVTSCSCNLDRAKMSPEMVIDLNDVASFRKLKKESVEVIHKYILEAKSQSKKEIFLTIKCDYILEYTAKKEITREFFDIYKKTSLLLNSWPFFREFVNNITSRMYIPPLTLPLLKR